MSDAFYGFALIAAIILLGSFLLRRLTVRRMKRDGSVRAGVGMEECQEEVISLLELLERQAADARRWAHLATSHDERDYARFFSLVAEGNALQGERLCEVFGCKGAGPVPDSEEEEKGVQTLVQAMREMSEGNDAMHAQCSEVKAFLRRVRKIKAYQRMREFDDFLDTRKRVMADFRDHQVDAGQTMKMCRICGSLFINNVPAFCLGCSAMNVEFGSYGPDMQMES